MCWGDFAQVRNNCFHVDNMKELFQDIHIDSIMTRFMFCFTFVADHNTDYIMLYEHVQLSE